MSDDVLVVDNYDSFTRNLTAAIAESGRGFHLVRNDDIRGEEIARFRKILVSPGPGIPSEAGGVCDLIRNYAPAKSILGICLGHQAIAEVFGGRLVKLARPDHGIRRGVTIIDRECYLFEGLPEQIDAGLYHSWTVSPEPFPACLKVTALSAAGEVMALSHREYDLHGLQFHPESVMSPLGRTILENWLRHP